jgi:cytochrome c biogenesis protein CcdA/glutaredoxin
MKKLLIPFLLLFLLFNTNIALAQNDTINVVFFYGEGCPHCGRVEPHIQELQTKYVDINFETYEIYNNRTNLLVLNDYFNRYGVPEYDRGVPVVFIGNKYLVGDSPILENLETDIIRLGETNGITEPIETVGEVDDKSPTAPLETISLAVITSAGLVDSINPCALAVLIILLSAILATGDKKKALKTGLSFIISIYIVYFLFGMGIFSVIQISGLSYYFYKILGIFAIIIGIFNIKDYFWYGGCGFVTEIPRTWRPMLKKILGGVTSPIGAFIAGFAVSLFELPCTGGPYIFILGLLAEKVTRVTAIPILLYYNLLFIIPLILVLLGVYFGLSSIEKAEKWRTNNIRRLHLITGTIMIALGLVVLFAVV